MGKHAPRLTWTRAVFSAQDLPAYSRESVAVVGYSEGLMEAPQPLQGLIGSDRRKSGLWASTTGTCQDATTTQSKI